jgi:flavin-dependent dehydrogenase
MTSVSVIGAGPAGLAAAIELARHGTPVTVYEQHRSAGGRFHGDFQAIENWTTDQDALVWLERLGVAPDFPYRPTRELTLADSTLEQRVARSDRPLLYLVKRGPETDSLDRHLAAQAAACGVEFRYGCRVRPTELAGPVIVAAGPPSHGTQGVVVGIVASTSHADQVVAIASERLAPRGYAYCVIWSGRATIATVLVRDFRQAWGCLAAARRAFATMGLTDFREMCRFGGRAHVSATGPLAAGARSYAGEAAGLQDYLFGFGLRYALLSGHLAARAILTGAPYERLVARQLRGSLRAGIVGRLLYNRLGDAGYRRFFKWLGRPGDLRERAKRIYALNPLYRVLWPIARLALGPRLLADGAHTT